MQKSEGEVTKLNTKQSEAVDTTDGPVLVVAGAGTGKTRVIVERISRLLASGTPPKRLLALTFTEKAAAEMQDRVNEATGAYQTELPIMTFNAYGEAMLRRHTADIGLGRNFTLIGENAQVVFLRERIDELKLDYFAPVGRPDGLLSDIKDYFSHLKQNVISPADYQKYVATMPKSNGAEILEQTKHAELAQAYDVYIRLTRTANVIDYDDQIYLLIELLRQRPNVLKEVQASYDFVLVDEFQDTNAMQSVLVDMVVGPKQNLFVVGDDDQSIYGWRGATLANILDFKNRYPKAQEVTLIKNYRSTQQILDTAYLLIQHNNPHRLEEKLKINKRLSSDRSGQPPQIYSFENLDSELQWVAEDIKRRVGEGTAPGSIAVLARRNTTIKRLHERLEFAGVEHVVIGQKYELYQEPVIRTLLEAIKAVVDPTDNTSLYHSLSGPLFSVPVHALGQLAGTARRAHQTLTDAIETSDDSELNGAQQALAQIKKWREQSIALTVGQLTYEILESSGYKAKLYAALADDPAIAIAVSRLSELFQTMKEFEQIALQPSATQYVEALPALQAAGDSGEDGTLDLSAEAVNLLSVHKAKGLEWPIVYIVDCTEGSFPLRESAQGIALPAALQNHTASEADDHIYEERRLMYVAMTRARYELILTYAERHSLASPRKPSRFLAEAFSQDHFKPQQPGGAFELASFGGTAVPRGETIAIPKHILNGEHVSLSVSQVKKYLQCPLDFYYCYVLNVPQEPSAALAYGLVMHSLVEDINRSLIAGQLAPLKQLQVRLHASWPQAGHLSAGQRQRALDQAEATLKAMYGRIKANPRVPLHSEQLFSFTIADYKLTVSGRFDAVFSLGDGVEIVDYKTGQIDTSEKAKQRATADEQLTLYALAWQRLHNELPVLVTLDFIDSGLTGSVKKSQRGIDGAYTRLQKVADGIRAKDFTPGQDHRYCLHPL